MKSSTTSTSADARSGRHVNSLGIYRRRSIAVHLKRRCVAHFSAQVLQLLISSRYCTQISSLARACLSLVDERIDGHSRPSRTRLPRNVDTVPEGVCLRATRHLRPASHARVFWPLH